MPPATKPPPARDWDVILVASLFIAGCLAVSIGLPLWHSEHEKTVMTRVAAPEFRRSAPPIVPSPQQIRAASAAFGQGTLELQTGHYSEAAGHFKKALERHPTFTEAYLGLADASFTLGDTQAAVLNAEHALDLWTNDQTLHVDHFTREQVLSWAHRLLGTSLLRRTEGALRKQPSDLEKIDVSRALFHCRQALSLGHDDIEAQRCVQAAAKRLEDAG